MENGDRGPRKIRILKKVRPGFLNKRAEENEIELTESSEPFYKSDGELLVLHRCLGLVEKDRKICIDSSILTSHVSIAGIVLDDQPFSQAVVITLKVAEEKPGPYFFIAKRLESYGDLELAQWAQRLINYYTNYPKVISNYFNLFQSDDNKIRLGLMKSNSRALVICKQIEAKYPFRRLLFVAKKESMMLLSTKFSQRFLKEIGYTAESFIELVKKEGLPALFDGDSTAHIEIAKRFLDCTVFEGDIIQPGEEYITYFYDEDGYKRPFVVQFISVLETTPDGLFVSGYFLIKRSGSNLNIGKNKSVLEEIEQNALESSKNKDDVSSQQSSDEAATDAGT